MLFCCPSHTAWPPRAEPRLALAGPDAEHGASGWRHGYPPLWLPGGKQQPLGKVLGRIRLHSITSCYISLGLTLLSTLALILTMWFNLFVHSGVWSCTYETVPGPVLESHLPHQGRLLSQVIPTQCVFLVCGFAFMHSYCVCKYRSI